MSLTGLLIGLLEVVLTVVVLLLLGAIVRWGLKLLLNIDLPAIVVRLYIAAVGLIALIQIVYMLATGLAPFAHVRIGM